jgi:hypothetical protein
VTRKHDERVLARLREIPALSEVVYAGEVPKVDEQGQPVRAPQRYVLVHSNRGIARPDRLAGFSLRMRKTYWVHSVGASQAQADAVAERVIAKLLDWTPAVDGFSCERITHEASQPVQRDDAVRPPLYYGVDQFDFFTTPTADA